jgi:hypothetical protein
MAQVGRYRVRKGRFGKAILQTLIKTKNYQMQDIYYWEDCKFDQAPDVLIAAESYPNLPK